MIIWKLRALFITKKTPLKWGWIVQRPLWEFLRISNLFAKIYCNVSKNYIQRKKYFFLDTFTVFKVRIFWEGHIILQNLHLTFVFKAVETILVGIFVFIESLQPHDLINGRFFSCHLNQIFQQQRDVCLVNLFWHSIFNVSSNLFSHRSFWFWSEF